MMLVAHQANCIELAKITNWTTLYWWNLENKKWQLGNKKLNKSSIPAYNFEFLFEKLRPVFLIQDDASLLQSFRLLLKSDNPADNLCELAIMIAKKGLFK